MFCYSQVFRCIVERASSFIPPPDLAHNFLICNASLLASWPLGTGSPLNVFREGFHSSTIVVFTNNTSSTTRHPSAAPFCPLFCQTKTTGWLFPQHGSYVSRICTNAAFTPGPNRSRCCKEGSGNRVLSPCVSTHLGDARGGTRIAADVGAVYPVVGQALDVAVSIQVFAEAAHHRRPGSDAASHHRLSFVGPRFCVGFRGRREEA